MDFARSEFKLNRTGEDGVTLRSKLEHAERSTGKTPESLKTPYMPLELSHVWQWFCDLDSSRTSNGFGLNPLSFQEIKAWSELTGNRPTPWEVSLLKRLDVIYIQEGSSNG